MIALPTRFRLLLWRVAHFWKYWPEIRWFFWGIRLRLCLLFDRMAGRTPLLFALTVWGHRQFIRPVMEALRKSGKKYSLYLILDQQDDLPTGNLLGVARWRVRPYRDYLPFGKHFVALLAADIAERYPPSSCPIRVLLYHGLPSKFVHFTKKRALQYTHVFTYGPLSRETWEDALRCYPELSGKLEILDVGYPKSDMLFTRGGKKKEVVSQFGLNPSLPTVLYAPAFNRGGAVERYGKAVFDTLAGLENVNVLVKLHPVSYDKSVVGVHSQGIYWPDVADSYNGPTFRHAGNIDVTDCLIAADVLVTDISGVALEYYLLDRPVIYLESPGYYQSIGVENGGGDNYFVNVGRPAGVEVRDMPSLKVALHEAFANPKRNSAEREQLAKRLLYNPGQGTKACVETLEKLLAESKSNGGRASA
ncbi:MAG: CDP-glycerol glycerophosphotransferase family protein [Kiritimatiellae bacterium]|nr:CDP-glycerol glycerophosphotransferase family protein [Kiritimatiellia bacterium]